MGKAKIRRTIYVTDKALLETKEFKALEEKGHHLFYDPKPLDTLVLGPNCRMVMPETLKYVELALKELGKVEVRIEDDSPSSSDEEEEVEE